MSMQEIYSLTMELNEVKRFIEKMTGMKFEGAELRDINTEDIKKLQKKFEEKSKLESKSQKEAIKELDALKNMLSEIVSDNQDTKKRIEDMQMTIDSLREEVTRAQTVQSSAAVMLNRLTTELQSISADLATKVNSAVDTAPLDKLIAELKSSTSSLATAVAESSNAIKVKEVVLNATDTATPTVQVIMPEVLPENVTVTAEQIVETVDPAATEPQIILTVEAAPEPVAEPTTVIETPEGQVNVNVEVPVEAAAVAENAGIDVVEAVQEAVAEAAAATPEAPVAEPVAEAVPVVEPAPVVEPVVGPTPVVDPATPTP